MECHLIGDQCATHQYTCMHAKTPLGSNNLGMLFNSTHRHDTRRRTWIRETGPGFGVTCGGDRLKENIKNIGFNSQNKFSTE